MTIKVMEVVDPQFSAPISYFVDVPCDNEFADSDLRRIRIPRELARYLKQLQDANRDYKEENKMLRIKLKKRLK